MCPPCIEGEQTLGAVSVNGSLHLTHTSPPPIPGLLAGIEEELRKACATFAMEVSRTSMKAARATVAAISHGSI